MKKYILIWLAVLSASLWAGNSIFSYQGYPVRYFGRDIYSLGMGDAGSSDIFRNNAGFANPALHHRGGKTIFGTGVLFGYTGYSSKYVDAGGASLEQSYRDDSLDLPYFSLSIPYKKNRLGFQISTFASGLVKNQFSPDSLRTEYHEADRYLYRADLIYSYAYKNFSVGAAGNYFFGHDNRTLEYITEGTTIPTNEKLKKSVKNPTLSFGAMQSMGDHSLGVYSTLPVKLEGKTVYSSLNTDEEATDYSYDLPLSLGFGYTGMYFDEYKLAFDVNYENYSSIDSAQRDGIKIGFGIAYEPTIGTKKNWYAKLPLRAGFSHRMLPFDSENGNAIDENAISLGMSIPLKGGENKLDIGAQYLQRGALKDNDLQDRSLMFMVGFTGLDIISKAPDRTRPRDIPIAEDMGQW